MSPDDVSPYEMGTNRHDEDDELERLLEGSADAREQLPELTIFVDDLQAMQTPSPGVEDLHVAAMMSESSRLLADNGDPVARPVSKAHGPASQASGLPMRRSTPMVKLLLAKVMAPLVAVFTIMGGLAYAQVLPDPLQDVVADAGGAVGLDLPDSDDGDVDEATEVEDADEADEATEVEDDADTTHESDPAEGDDDEGATDDEADGTEGDDDEANAEGEGAQGDDDEADDSTEDQDDSTDDGSGNDDGDNSGPGGGDGGGDNSGSGGGSDDENGGSDDEVEEAADEE